MHIEKRSDISARKVKLPEEEILPVIERYLKRIEMMHEKGSFRKLIVPLGKQNIEILSKLAKEKLGIEIEYIPVNSAENLYAISPKKQIESKRKFLL
ncbi:MAG: hypothetical protein RQ952_02910 [Thermoproteota archaeon]|jgi:hypothetical protein|nr:hypothetical protein [Thermoproteota archaeon]